ncbi:MAG: PLP-dependent aspartate aminotransferase family protein [Thermoanaerobaculia bacterium]|nr:PLP-dependent aspartate aminotransferase family protein [Thermoanaerobaculia bacterium]
MAGRETPNRQIDARQIETKLIHAGEASPRYAGAISMPIFQSSTFEYSGESDYHDVRYIRLNNTPNHVVLHAKLAALENAEGAVVASSGMAAISTALLSLLASGDHLIVQDTLYGGTHDLVSQDLPALGIGVTFVDGRDPSSWATQIRPTTRAIYVEALSNPLLQLPDLEAVVGFAREHAIVSMIDNTFTSPMNFRPAELGFDLSLHSATKYLNGHTDIVAGAVIGRTDLVDQVRRKLNHLGGTLDPHAAFLLHRGLKTLAVRVRHQNVSALRLAEFLDRHPAVTRVNYPGLPGHPQHALASRLFDGFGGMISFELEGGLAAVERCFDRLTLPASAPSLGGVESLVTRPSTTSHAGMERRLRESLGISDTLVRLSVGLEATEDLIQDFEQALTS